MYIYIFHWTQNILCRTTPLTEEEMKGLGVSFHEYIEQVNDEQNKNT